MRKRVLISQKGFLIPKIVNAVISASPKLVVIVGFMPPYTTPSRLVCPSIIYLINTQHLTGCRWGLLLLLLIPQHNIFSLFM